MTDKERQLKLRMALPKVRDYYKALYAKTQEMGGTVLEMMRHPEATPELILDAQSRYARTYASYLEVRESLRKLYPQQHSVFLAQYPWA